MVARLDQIRSELILLGLLWVAACDRPRSVDSGGSGRSGVAGAVVDSILPRDEAIRRFRAGVDSVSRLDGPRSRDELLQRFRRGVRGRNRRALESLTVTRAEYAFLVYPDLPISRPPYTQPPDIAWLLLATSTASNINKLTTSAASRFELLTYACAASPTTHGRVRLHSGCTVRAREQGVERPIRLFGSIIERDGRWKFLSLDGDL
jgi:hypothetical protein